MGKLLILGAKTGKEILLFSAGEEIFVRGSQLTSIISPRGVKSLILSLSMVLKKNTAESKGMTYGKHELDAVRKFFYGAWLLLAKPLNILHLCMGGDIHKINTNWILLTCLEFHKFYKKLGSFVT